jgi:hypothetical protein
MVIVVLWKSIPHPKDVAMLREAEEALEKLHD